MEKSDPKDAGKIDYKDTLNIIGNISQEQAKEIVNSYIGFPVISKFTSGATNIILIIFILSMAVSFSYFIQANLSTDDWRRSFTFSILTITLGVLISQMVVRYSYSLLDEITMFSWIIFFTLLYLPLILHLYYLEESNLNDFQSDLMRMYGVLISVVGIAVGGSPLSCQIANIIFNYSKNEQPKSIKDTFISEILKKLPPEHVERLINTFSGVSQASSEKRDIRI